MGFCCCLLTYEGKRLVDINTWQRQVAARKYRTDERNKRKSRCCSCCSCCCCLSFPLRKWSRQPHSYSLLLQKSCGPTLYRTGTVNVVKKRRAPRSLYTFGWRLGWEIWLGRKKKKRENKLKDEGPATPSRLIEWRRESFKFPAVSASLVGSEGKS